MPVEHFELIKLITGIIVITIPGYLWSFTLFKHLSRLERFVFGFVFGLGILTCTTFMLNAIFDIRITQTFVVLLFALYASPAFILYGISIYRFGLPKIDLTPIKNKKFIILVGILCFTLFMMFLPHLSNNYYLPFHVDEWIHWSYSQSVMESGSTTFTNPYTGVGNTTHAETGFHICTACIAYLSSANLPSIFLFLPSIIGAFISLTAFNIGERSKRKFGLEAAFIIAFIPTTIRFLGPSFYVAVTLGLLLLIFVIWLGQLKKSQGALLVVAFIGFMFIVHPPTALAGITIMIIFSVFLLLGKEYKATLLTGIFSIISIIPIIIAYYLTTRWDYSIEMFLQAAYGKEYLLKLPGIWISFEHFGVITWVLFVIGIYYSFINGKSLKRAMSFASIIFIIIIGFYSQLGYGVPILYERAFLYLFVLVGLTAGVGLSELRKSIECIAVKNTFKRYRQVSKNLRFIPPVVVCTLLLITAVSAHIEIPYYQMIDENDYETFIWIRNHIEDYRSENHSFDIGAVHPFKASPFSAITGIHIISSSMHPIYGISLENQMKKFLNEKCDNTSFLEQHRLSIIYGHCNNEYLKEIHENVFLYYGIPPEANFTFLPNEPTLNDTIYFTSDFTTPSNRIVQWEWNFGDGITSYGEIGGLEFDGIDDYVEIPDDPNWDISKAITIEIRMKLKSDLDCDENNNWRWLISKSGSWDVILEQNRRPTWSIRSDGKSHRWFGSTPTWPIDEWIHVVWTYESSTGEMTASINGNISLYNIGTPGSLDINNNSVQINRPAGVNCPNGSGNFPGVIQYVSIYKRVLTSDEISQNSNASSDNNIVTNGLAGWWRMNEMGKIVRDNKGNNDATIYGAKWMNYAEHKYKYPGTYNVNLTVWNEDGLNRSISKNITVI